MKDERRYGEEEVREIFETAAREGGPGKRAPVAAEGLTLSELREIGREVGLAPERITEAAAALDRRGEALPRRTWLGVPYAVGRAVELPGAPTDREWERIVADLRETFGAPGRVGSSGGIREWSHGNLHACVEPTETGYRLRLGTRKGIAREMAISGGFLVLLAVVVLIASVLAGQGTEKIFASLVLGGLGAAILGSTALTLPPWAREREAQMEALASRARKLLASDRDPGDPAGS